MDEYDGSFYSKYELPSMAERSKGRIYLECSCDIMFVNVRYSDLFIYGFVRPVRLSTAAERCSRMQLQG